MTRLASEVGILVAIVRIVVCMIRDEVEEIGWKWVEVASREKALKDIFGGRHSALSFLGEIEMMQLLYSGAVTGCWKVFEEGAMRLFHLSTAEISRNWLDIITQNQKHHHPK